MFEERRFVGWLKFFLLLRDQEEVVVWEFGIFEQNFIQEVVLVGFFVSFCRLLDEIVDFIELFVFVYVFILIFDVGFFVLVDKKLFVEVFEIFLQIGLFVIFELKVECVFKVIFLFKIFFVLICQVYVIGNGMLNEYLQEMEGV